MDLLALINIIIQLASISEELHIICLQNVSLSPLATFQCFKPFVKVPNLKRIHMNYAKWIECVFNPVHMNPFEINANRMHIAFNPSPVVD